MRIRHLHSVSQRVTHYSPFYEEPLYRALREDASELPPLRTRRWKKVLPPEEAERRAGDDAEYESQYPEEEIVIDPQIDEEAPEFKDPYVNGDEDELDTSGWPTQPVISS